MVRTLESSEGHAFLLFLPLYFLEIISISFLGQGHSLLGVFFLFFLRALLKDNLNILKFTHGKNTSKWVFCIFTELCTEFKAFPLPFQGWWKRAHKHPLSILITTPGQPPVYLCFSIFALFRHFICTQMPWHKYVQDSCLANSLLGVYVVFRVLDLNLLAPFSSWQITFILPQFLGELSFWSKPVSYILILLVELLLQFISDELMKMEGYLGGMEN